VFGDPCYGTYKKLSVVYYCKVVAAKPVQAPEEVIDYKFASVGENGQLNVNCANNNNLVIVEASYGTPNGDSAKNYKTSKCNAGNSKQIVSASCNGKNSCSVAAKN